MDKERTHGRETEAWDKKAKLKFVSDSPDKGENAQDCAGIKHESKRVTGEVGTSLGRNAVFRIIGGILGLLREIVNDYVSYVDSHGERLEARLIDNKRTKSEALMKAAALEKELLHLLEQAQKLPDDSSESE